MQHVTWVIDFGRRGSAPDAVNESLKALQVLERRRLRSREMFAATRALLAEARAVLAAGARAGQATGWRGRASRAAGRRRGGVLRVVQK